MKILYIHGPVALARFFLRMKGSIAKYSKDNDLQKKRLQSYNLYAIMGLVCIKKQECALYFVIN